MNTGTEHDFRWRHVPLPPHTHVFLWKPWIRIFSSLLEPVWIHGARPPASSFAFVLLPKMLSASLARRTPSIRCFSPRWMWQIGPDRHQLPQRLLPPQAVPQTIFVHIRYFRKTRLLFKWFSQEHFNRKQNSAETFFLRLTAKPRRYTMGWTTEK